MLPVASKQRCRIREAVTKDKGRSESKSRPKEGQLGSEERTGGGDGAEGVLLPLRF